MMMMMMMMVKRVVMMQVVITDIDHKKNCHFFVTDRQTDRTLLLYIDHCLVYTLKLISLDAELGLVSSG